MKTREFVEFVLVRFEWLVLLYFVVVNGLYTVLLVAATLEVRQQRSFDSEQTRRRIMSSEATPTVSMVAPAFNEGATAVSSAWALLTLEYPRLEVVFVNDGSSDDTLQALVEEFDLTAIHPIFQRRLETQPVKAIYRSRVNPNLIVVDKQNGGKADALNAGINIASGELVCSIDADTLIEPDALLRMVRPFITRDDVVAAGGTIRVANGCEVKNGRVQDVRVTRKPLPGFQVIEYARAFLFGRLGWNRLGGNLIISGAFGLFRRDSLVEAGGYLHETVGEDMELIARLRRKGIEQGGPQRVDFIPDPLAWTEAPETLRVLGRQRDRWHRGLTDTLLRHRRVVGNPRYKALGLVVTPYFFGVELLAPIVEAAGLIALVIGLALGAIDLGFALLFFLCAYGLAMVLTVATLALEEITYRRYRRMSDRLVLLGWAFLEPLGYRQLTVVWRLRGIARYLRGTTDWGVMTRKGFTPPPSS